MLQTEQSGGTHLSWNTLLHFFLWTELPFLFWCLLWPLPGTMMTNPAPLTAFWVESEREAGLNLRRQNITWLGSRPQASLHFQWPWYLQSSARRYLIVLLTPKLSIPVSYSFQVTTGGSAVKLILKRLWHDHINSFYCGEGQGLLQKIADLNRAQGVSW